MNKYFEGAFLQINLNFGYLSQATSVEIHDNLIRLGMPLYLAIFEKCTPGNYCNDY